jgi:alcohol dehydrogenase class IV
MAANVKALRERDSEGMALQRYARIAALVTNDPQAAVDDGVEWVRKLVAGLPIPGLRAYGIRTEHFADLVAKAAKASSMKPNPIELSPEELTEILERAN